MDGVFMDVITTDNMKHMNTNFAKILYSFYIKFIHSFTHQYSYSLSQNKLGCTKFSLNKNKLST